MAYYDHADMTPHEFATYMEGLFGPRWASEDQGPADAVAELEALIPEQHRRANRAKPRLLADGQAAAWVGLTRKSFNERVRKGTGPRPYRSTKPYVFDVADLSAWTEKRKK